MKEDLVRVIKIKSEGVNKLTQKNKVYKAYDTSAGNINLFDKPLMDVFDSNVDKFIKVQIRPKKNPDDKYINVDKVLDTNVENVAEVTEEKIGTPSLPVEKPQTRRNSDMINRIEILKALFIGKISPLAHAVVQHEVEAYLELVKTGKFLPSNPPKSSSVELRQEVKE